MRLPSFNLEGSIDERVSRLYAPKWVAYSRGNEALARMAHLLNHPPSGRMPCMLLHGDSNTGKTMRYCWRIRQSAENYEKSRELGAF